MDAASPNKAKLLSLSKLTYTPGWTEWKTEITRLFQGYAAKHGAERNVDLYDREHAAGVARGLSLVLELMEACENIHIEPEEEHSDA